MAARRRGTHAEGFSAESWLPRGRVLATSSNVPTIEFEASSAGRAKVVDRPEGGDLLDICDEVRAPIPFSCRSASCATCEIKVLEGMDLFEPPNDEEADLLGILGKKDHRIACQARIRSGSGVIRLRAVAVGPPVASA
jgi:2Fe-2S ferredoxin